MARVVQLDGLADYRDVHALQSALLQARIAGDAPDTILLLEHADVITVGRSRGAARNVLDAAGMPVVEVERGGDVTWHGPGQLVAYPIVRLEGDRQDLHRHLRALEQAVIDVLRALGLDPRRDDRNTGVWLPAPPSEGPGALPRKVCSVGIACRRRVTWHGHALNVPPDPAVWERIRPCGFDAGVMTTLAASMNAPPSVAELMRPLAAALIDRLELGWDGVLAHATAYSEGFSPAWPTLP